MKTHSFFISVMLCLAINVNNSEAQITVNLPDYAVVGDSITRGVDTLPSSGILVGSTGNQTWDFTSLQIHTLDSIIFVDPGTTPWGTDFPGSNLAYGSQTVYYQTSSVSNVLVDGYAGNDPFGIGLIVVAPYSPVQMILEFPSTDGNVFTDTSAYDITMSTAPLGLPVPDLDSLRIVHNSYVTSVIDAYGNIDIPGGSFAAIRQLYTENIIDSIFIYCNNPADCFAFVVTLPFGWSLLPDALLALFSPGATNPTVDTTYTYKWWANGEDLPVAEVETDAPGGNALVASYKIGNSVLGMIISQFNVLCKDSCSGTATATGVSGVLPYTYLWSDGQTTSTATGLCDGTYSVVVIDGTGDTSSAASVTITEPLLVLSATISTTADSGNGDGTATVTVSGGTSPYFYEWSTSPIQFSAIATNLTSGDYFVTVTDDNGCEIIVSDSVALVASCNPVSSFSSSGTNICEGETVNFTNSSTGSTGYTWLENMVSFATTTNASRTFNTAGTYTISLIANDGSCSDTSTVIITVNSRPSISTASSTDASSCGVSDGSIIIAAIGGTAPLQYSIDGGTTFLASGGFSGLGTGNYTVAISDANDCVVIGITLTISAPGAPTASAGADDATCEGDTYTLSGAMGGSASSITWTSSGSGSFDDPSLMAAVYTPSAGDIFTGSVILMITTDDPAGSCVAASDDMVLTINPDPTKPNITNVGNTLSSDAAISYQWFFNGDTIAGETGQFHVATQTGFYTVTITDNNGCTATSDPFGFTGIEENVSFSKVNIYPNPNTGQFTLELDILENTSLSIQLYNFTGQRIYTEEIGNVSGNLIRKLDISNYAKGIYYLQIVTDGRVITKKVVSQ